MKRLFYSIVISAITGFILTSCANHDVALEAVNMDGKWGFANMAEEIVIPCRYDDVRAFVGGFAAVENDGKWGFINAKGEEISPCNYDFVLNFSEGLAVVKKNGEYGYINTKGDVIVSCQYDSADSFSNGFAKVENDGKFGFINTKGELVIPCQYDEANDFSEGKAKVKKGEIWGYVDKKGVDTFRGADYERELKRIEEEKRIAEEKQRQIEEERMRRMEEERKQKELDIMLRLHELQKQIQRQMYVIESLYHQKQRTNMVLNPEPHFALVEACGKWIDMISEQIRLAQQLGDDELVREYKERRDRAYEVKDRMTAVQGFR